MFIWRNEHMKKIIILAVSLLITASVFAQDGIIAWSTYKDTNSGGSSTANIVTEEKTISGVKYTGVTTWSGTVTTDFQYGFAGMNSTVTPEFLAGLKSAKGIRIWVSGDGKNYNCRIETNDRPDYCFHQFSFNAPVGSVKQYDIMFTRLKQESWGVKKNFNPNNITQISFQTIGQPIPSYKLHLIKVELIK